MASNDFIIDLVDKLHEESIEFLLVTVQKGKKEHKSNAYYNIYTIDGADMILTTADEVFSTLGSEDDPDADFKEGAD
jgi:hypothetical protein